MRTMHISLVVVTLCLVVGANSIPLPDQDAVEAHFNKKIELLEDLIQNVRKRTVIEYNNAADIYIEEDNDYDDNEIDDENGNVDTDNDSNSVDYYYDTDENADVEDEGDDDGNDDVQDEGDYDGNDDVEDEGDDDGNDDVEDEGDDDGNDDVEDEGDDDGNNDDDDDSNDGGDDNDDDDDDADNDDGEDDDDDENNDDDDEGDNDDGNDDDDNDDDYGDDDGDAEDDDDDNDDDENDGYDAGDCDDDDDDDDDENVSGSGSGSDSFDYHEVENEEDEKDKLDGSEKYDTGLHVCSEEYSSKCTAPLDNIDSFADIVEELCENNEVMSCLQMIFENCVDEEGEKEKGMRYLKELSEGMDVLCKNKGSPSNPLECLENNEKLAPKAIECTVLAANEAKTIIEGDDISPADLKCLGGHIAIECITDTATELCGKDAGKLLEISLESDLKDDPEASSSMYCQNEENDESKKKKRRK